MINYSLLKNNLGKNMSKIDTKKVITSTKGVAVFIHCRKIYFTTLQFFPDPTKEGLSVSNMMIYLDLFNGGYTVRHSY